MAASDHLQGLQFTHSYDDVVAAGNDPFPAEQWGHTGRYALTSVPVNRMGPHSMHMYDELDTEIGDGPYERKYIHNMARTLSAGGGVPPILVQHSDRGELQLGDGGHRLMAHMRIGRPEILAFVAERRPDGS
jgi:hypothetical protein